MTVYLIKKLKNRIYKSEEIVKKLFGRELSHNEDGAPQVEGCFISVTDTKNYWACAFSDKAIGIDMEEADRKLFPAIVKKLHKAERDYLSVLSEGSSEWREELLNIWTKKEAYSKFLGKGLAAGFSSFCVLEGCEQMLKTPLYNLKYKDLFFGSSEEICIEKLNYDAPFEKTALEAGADILDLCGCSAETLKKKLFAKGYSEEESQNAVDILLERGFLNDNAYSESISEKCAFKGYSSGRIEYELKQKGISPELAKSFSDAYKEGDRERACKAAEKALGGKTADDKTKAKIARKLSSLGYDVNIVYDIINKLG